MSARLLFAAALVVAIATSLPAAPAWAQDQLEVKVIPLRHASFILQFGDQTIIVDPVEGPDYRGYSEPTAILITDIHPDHWDRDTVAMLMGTETKVVAPDVVGWGGIDTVLENGEVADAEGILIEAVPAYNLERGPREGEFYHPEGRGNGYIVHLGFERIYIAGDTECVPETVELKDVSMAFMPMNMPYTMTPTEAAECAKKFMPKVVYPYHYRGSDPEVFRFRLEDTPQIEVRILDWYPNQ